MEFILELLIEIILGGITECSSSKIVPKPIRILLNGLIIAFYMFMLVLFGILIFKCDNVTARIILIGVELLFIWFIIHIFRKFMKKNSD